MRLERLIDIEINQSPRVWEGKGPIEERAQSYDAPSFSQLNDVVARSLVGQNNDRTTEPSRRAERPAIRCRSRSIEAGVA